MIVFYSNICESCSGNQALTRMKAECKKHNVEFQERRTILWEVYEKEANQIMKAFDVKLPFFYNTETHQVLEGNTFTPIEKIKELINETI